MTAWLIVAMLLVETSLPPGSLVRAAVAVGVVAVAPALALPAVALGGVALLVRRARSRAVEQVRLREDAALLADLTALALTGGLGVHPALEIAAGAVGGPIAEEVESLLRRARVDGLTATMSGAGGAGRELYRVIGRAVATGSALLDQVTRVADEMHADIGARRLGKVRRVPVTMLFPLTLLILPGFLLLTIAPALLDAFMHLEL
jgi:Flp pilus assembly protein TadB